MLFEQTKGLSFQISTISHDACMYINAEGDNLISFNLSKTWVTLHVLYLTRLWSASRVDAKWPISVKIKRHSPTASPEDLPPTVQLQHLFWGTTIVGRPKATHLVAAVVAGNYLWVLWSENAFLTGQTAIMEIVECASARRRGTGMCTRCRKLRTIGETDNRNGTIVSKLAHKWVPFRSKPSVSMEELFFYLGRWLPPHRTLCCTEHPRWAMVMGCINSAKTLRSERLHRDT